jgi:uncharacterized membrane protein YecN with MAPEG domain
VALGSARDKALERAIRVHANFSEYVPLIGLLLVILEVQGSPVWLLHGLGGLLLIGRLLHAYGLAQIEEDFRFRTTGMMMTFVALGAAAIAVMVRVLV